MSVTLFTSVWKMFHKRESKRRSERRSPPAMTSLSIHSTIMSFGCDASCVQVASYLAQSLHRKRRSTGRKRRSRGRKYHPATSALTTVIAANIQTHTGRTWLHLRKPHCSHRQGGAACKEKLQGAMFRLRVTKKI